MWVYVQNLRHIAKKLTEIQSFLKRPGNPVELEILWKTNYKWFFHWLFAIWSRYYTDITNLLLSSLCYFCLTISCKTPSTQYPRGRSPNGYPQKGALATTQARARDLWISNPTRYPLRHRATDYNGWWDVSYILQRIF